jgi:hypothetical protein
MRTFSIAFVLGAFVMVAAAASAAIDPGDPLQNAGFMFPGMVTGPMAIAPMRVAAQPAPKATVTATATTTTTTDVTVKPLARQRCPERPAFRAASAGS